MLISNILLGLCFFAFSSTVDGQTTVELDCERNLSFCRVSWISQPFMQMEHLSVSKIRPLTLLLSWEFGMQSPQSAIWDGRLQFSLLPLNWERLMLARWAIVIRHTKNRWIFLQYGNSCIPVPQSTVVSGTSEDCLFVNVGTTLAPWIAIFSPYS